MNGIFAIEKPCGISSNKFMMQLKDLLTKSNMCATELQKQTHKKRTQYEAETGKKASNRVLRKVSKVKMGHGGTLDPIASGVLVIGVGSGTKQLTNYLSGTTKVYECEGVFGCRTTSGDLEGEVFDRTSVQHLTFEDLKTVEEKFTGSLKQVPPIYSALKMNGKPLYEYARKGEALPRKIQSREVNIYDLKILPDSLTIVDKVPLTKPLITQEPEGSEGSDVSEDAIKNLLNSNLYFSKEYNEKHGITEEDPKAPTPEPLTEKESEEIKENGDLLKAPSIHLRTKVSSGTYIRSLIDDIGKAMRSSCYMTELARLQQQDWSIEEGNVFKMEDFTKKDEVVWSKVLKMVLEDGAKVNVVEELQKAQDDFNETHKGDVVVEGEEPSQKKVDEETPERGVKRSIDEL